MSVICLSHKYIATKYLDQAFFFSLRHCPAWCLSMGGIQMFVKQTELIRVISGAGKPFISETIGLCYLTI
jgi:hypothetical protein